MTSELILEIVKRKEVLVLRSLIRFRKRCRQKALQAKAGVQGAQPLEKKQSLLKFENRI
jgi:hypothetical protein